MRFLHHGHDYALVPLYKDVDGVDARAKDATVVGVVLQNAAVCTARLCDGESEQDDVTLGVHTLVLALQSSHIFDRLCCKDVQLREMPCDEPLGAVPILVPKPK